MKKALLLAVTLASFTAFADASFDDIMKAMGKDFGVLSKESKAGTFQADALPAAQDLLAQVKLAQTTAPDPADVDLSTDAKKADFAKDLQDEADQAALLVQALQAGNTANAQAAMAGMMKALQAGHGEFRQQ